MDPSGCMICVCVVMYVRYRILWKGPGIIIHNRAIHVYLRCYGIYMYVDTTPPTVFIPFLVACVTSGRVSSYLLCYLSYLLNGMLVVPTTQTQIIVILRDVYFVRVRSGIKKLK